MVLRTDKKAAARRVALLSVIFTTSLVVVSNVAVVAQEKSRKEQAQEWITVRATKGPSDYSYDPAKRDITSQEKRASSLHSIILTISANPLHDPQFVKVKKSGKETDTIRNYDQDLTNLLLDIDLLAGTQKPGEDFKPAGGTAPRIRVIAIYPNQTLASAHDGALGTLGRIAGTVFDGLSGTRKFGSQVSVNKDGDDTSTVNSPQADVAYKGTGLGNVLGNIVPPHPTTMQYGYIEDNDSFGWRLRQNTRVKESVSLLGIHSGLVVYEVLNPSDDAPEITSVQISSKVLSRWRRDFEDGDNWVRGNNQSEVINLDTQDQRKNKRIQDLKSVKSLEGQPVLIPIDDVAAILQIALETSGHKDFIDNPNCYLGLSGENELTIVNTYSKTENDADKASKAITRSSLERFLGLNKPEKVATININRSSAP